METKLNAALATVAAGYIKRMLEGRYDELFETEVGRSLKSLSTASRWSIEAGLNLLTAAFDQRLADDTALERLVKDIAKDFAPEVSKRLINGVRAQVRSNATSESERELLHCFLDLEDAALIEMLSWLYATTPSSRQAVLERLPDLSSEELAHLARLSAEDRDKLLHLIGETPASGLGSEPSSRGETFLGGFNRRWADWLAEVDSKK